MKKYIFSLFVLCFSFLLLAGCNSAQTSQSPIQLQTTIAIEPEYDSITVLGKFIIAEKDNQSAIYSYNGTTYQLIAPLGKYTVEKSFANYTVGDTLSVYTEESDSTNYYENGKMIYNGLIDLEGNIVVPLHDKISHKGVFEAYKYYNADYFKLDDFSTQTTSFYDSNGNLLTKVPSSPKDTIIPLQIDDQIITLRSPSIQSEEATANLFDKNGNKLLETDYKYLHPFQNYFIAKSQDNSFGIIDLKGNVIIPFDYSLLKPSNEADSNNTWLNARNKDSEAAYLMNLQGEKLLEDCGYSNLKILDDGNIQVNKSGKEGIVTPDNKILIDFNNYSLINVIQYNDKFYIHTTEKNKTNDDTRTLTFYDENYRIIKSIDQIIPYQFIPETGHYLFKNNQGLIGALDDKGEQLFSPTYQQLYHLNAQYYLAKKDDTYALIDSSTKNIIQSGFDSADFNDEIIQVTKNGQKYFYDYNCNPIELIYDSNKITDFLLQDNSKGMNADISKDGANSVRKNDEYIDNPDGTKNMIILIESNTGKKGVALIPSMN